MGIHYHLAREESYGVVPAPPGLTPNFTNPPSIANRVVAANLAFMLLSTFFLTLRWHTSLSILRRVGGEDYIMTLAWILALLHGITCCILTRYGLGRHLWDVPFTVFNINFGKVAIISGSSYLFSIMLVKISILAFYLRIAPGKQLKIVIYPAMAIIIAYTVVAAIQPFYACKPIEKFWDITITTGSCINQYAGFLFSASMNVATDILVLVLPIAMLWRVHIPRRQKFGVAFMLMSGGFVLVAGIIRLVNTVLAYNKVDMTWDWANQSVWWAFEVHLAIICGCLPLGKAFLRRHFPKVIGRSTQNSYPRTRATIRSARQATLPSQEGDEVELCIGQGKAAEADLQLRTCARQLNGGEDASQPNSICDTAVDAERVEHTI